MREKRKEAKDIITIYSNKKECCGCTACMSICPKQAITMQPDEDGFVYPTVNDDLCVECGLCRKVCAFQNVPVTPNVPLATYAAINRNQSVLAASASGGVFAALALIIFEKNGVIFGCAFNNNMEPEHICVDNPTNIKNLQGSKYVQSSINVTYADAKLYLEQGRVVLYTGTPCQIAGLKSYLSKDYENLITADIICHGVPSATFFKGYINHLESKLKGKVIDFKFRDKSNGWGLIGKAVYEKNGAVRQEFIAPITSYYYSYFLKGDIYRENCYECKYASANRQGDFTMGDYWGIEKAHPEIETRNGVSVLLVNSAKGMALIERLGNNLDLTKSTFEQAREQNGQLRQPTAKSYKREAILKTWREGGFQAVADGFYKSNKKQLMRFRIKMLVLQPVKQWMRKG
ncbi:Coenzyme F420 hydrogenase/dehydrogenase, beta subunit C-terminal domain [Desulfosporosinus fructosivorans]